MFHSQSGSLDRCARRSESKAHRQQLERRRNRKMFFEKLEMRALMAVEVWTGLGANNNWSTGANWLDGTAPAATVGSNDDIVFPAGAARYVSNMDLGGTPFLRSITFYGGGYDLTAAGNTVLTLGGGAGGGGAIEAYNSSGTNRVEFGAAATNAISLGSDSVIRNAMLGGTLIIDASVRLNTRQLTFDAEGIITHQNDAIVQGTGVGGSILKLGAGTLNMNAANTYTGATTVSSGILVIGNAAGLGSAVGGTTVNRGAQVQMGNLTTTEPFTINGHGIFEAQETNSTTSAVALSFRNSGALVGTAATANFNGAITLASDSTIAAAGAATNFNGAISNAGFTLTANGNGQTLTIGGAISGSGALRVNDSFSGGTVALTNAANSYTGATTLTSGTLNLTGAGAITGSSSITVQPSTATATLLQLDNGGTNVADRIADGIPITLNGGTISLVGRNTTGAAASETLGVITLGKGHSTIQSSTPTTAGFGATNNLILTNLTRNSTATVNFSYTGAGGSGTVTNRISVVAANEAAVDGLETGLAQATSATAAGEGILAFATVNNSRHAYYESSTQGTAETTDAFIEMPTDGYTTAFGGPTSDFVRIVTSTGLAASASVAGLVLDTASSTITSGGAFSLTTPSLVVVGNINPTITLNATQSLNLSGDGIVINNGTGTTTINADISAASRLVKSGASTATLTLNGPKAFTNGTTLNSGTLNLGNITATLGSAASVVDWVGGTIAATAGTTINRNFTLTDANVVIGSNVTIGGAANTVTLAGRNRVDQAAATIVGGQLTGSGVYIKTGAQAITLTNNANNPGGLVLENNVIAANGAGTLGTLADTRLSLLNGITLRTSTTAMSVPSNVNIAANGGTITFDQANGFTFTGAATVQGLNGIVVNNTSALGVTFDGTMSGSGGFDKTGLGRLAFNGGVTKTFTGGTRVQAGSLIIGAPTATSVNLTNDASTNNRFATFLGSTATTTASIGALAAGNNTFVLIGENISLNQVAVAPISALGIGRLGATTVNLTEGGRVLMNATSYTGAGTGYDQLNASGDLIVGGVGSLSLLTTGITTQGKFDDLVASARTLGDPLALAIDVADTASSVDFLASTTYASVDLTLYPISTSGVAIWDGDTDGDWDDNTNWSSDTLPTNGQSLVFPFGANTFVTSNNLAGLTSAYNIIFTEDGYQLNNNVAGSEIALTAGILDASTTATANTVNTRLNLAADQSFTLLTAGDTLLVSSNISGLGGNDLSLVADLGGNFTLSGTSNYLGSTSVVDPTLAANGITLTIGSTTALGEADGTAAQGTTVPDGNSLVFNGVGVYAENEALSIGGNGVGGASGAIQNITADTTFPGPISIITATVLVDVANATTLILSGIISGLFGVTKQDDGTLELSNANTYDGATTINDGVLRVSDVALNGSASNLGDGTSLVFGGGELEFSGAGADTTDRVVTLNADATVNVSVGTGNLELSGVIDDGASSFDLTKNGPGTLTLSALNTYDGDTIINAGVLSVAAVSANGNPSPLGDGTTIVFGGGTLAFTGGALDTTNRTVTMNADATVDVTNAAGNLELTGVLDDGGGTFGLIKNGPGTLTLTANNDYDGATTINAGVLSISSDDNLGDAPGVATPGHLVINGGTLQATTASFTLNSNRGIALGDSAGSATGTIEVVGAAVVLTYGGIAADNGVGADGLTKSGAGTLLLTGANSYTGVTTINAGTLLVNGSTSTGAVNVNGSAILGGTGSIGGAVTLASTAAVAPGDSTTPLDTTNALSVDSVDFGGAGRQFNVEIGGTAANTFDQLIVSAAGGVILAGATLNVSLVAPFVPNPLVLQQFTIIDNAGTDAVSGIFAGLAEGAEIIVGASKFYISYSGDAGGPGSGNDVVLYSQPVVNGTGANDTLVIRGNAGTFGLTLNGGTEIYITPPAGAPINFYGGDGDDVLFVRWDDVVTAGFGGGTSTDPIPTAGINYNGQAEVNVNGPTPFQPGFGQTFGDVLRVEDLRAAVNSLAAIYTPDVATFGNGVVAVAGENITFSDLEPVDITGMATATLNLPGLNDSLTVAEGFDSVTATIPALVITGTSAGVSIESGHFFDNDLLVINTVTTGGDGNDSVTFTSGANGHLNDRIQVETGAGTDVVTINGNVTVAGNTGIDIEIDTQSIVLNGGTLTAAGGTIELDANSGAITSPGAGAPDISTSNLALEASTGIGTLLAPIVTAVSNLEAANATSTGIFINNTGALNIGGVNGTLSGVDASTAGDISIINAGSINIVTAGQDVTGPANISLEANGGTADIQTSDNMLAIDSAAGVVTLDAERDVLLGDSVAAEFGDVESGGNVILTAGRDVVLSDLTEVDALGIGTITVTAGRDIIVREGSSIESVGGSIGLDAGRDIRTSGDTTAIGSASGAITLDAVLDVMLGIAGTEYGDVISGDNLTIIAGQDVLVLDNSFADATGTGVVDINAGRHVRVLESGSRISSESGTIDIDAGGDFEIDTSASVDSDALATGTGAAITIDADNIIQDGFIEAPTAQVTLTATVGSITDNVTDTASEIDAGSLLAFAVTGIGTVANPLETELGTTAPAVAGIFSASNTTSGDIVVVNNGGAMLTLDNIAPLLPVTTAVVNGGAGIISITNLSPITVLNDVLANGAITLTATDNAGGADDMIVGDGVTAVAIDSAASTVTLNVGDDLTLNVLSTIEGDTGVTINIDQGVVDVGTGTANTLAGAIQTSTSGNVAINGGADADVFTQTGTITAVGSGNVIISLGAGNDNYNAASATAAITAADNATVPTTDDLIQVIGGDGVDTINLGDSTASATLTAAFTQVFGGDNNSLTLPDGPNEDDTILVRASTTTPFNINGDNPHATVNGDDLVLDLTGVPGIPTLTIGGVGAGIYSFGGGYQSVGFFSIEEPSTTPAATLVNLVLDMKFAGFETVGADTDTIRLYLNPVGMNTHMQIEVDAVPVLNPNVATINSFTIIGSDDNDILQIDETAQGLPQFAAAAPVVNNTGFGGGVSNGAHLNATADSFLDAATGSNVTVNNVTLHFDGATGANSMVFNYTTAHVVQYSSDTLDSANSGNVGVLNAAGTTLQSLLSFANLNPLTFGGAGGTLIADASSTPAVTSLTISDTGGADGYSTITPNGGSGFETTRFGGFNSLVVRSGTGAETINLIAIDPNTLNGVTLDTSITLDADNLASTDAGSADTIQVQSLPNQTVVATLLGGAGSDTFQLFNAGNTVDNILGRVIVQGEDGNVVGNNDQLIVNDSGDGSGDVINLDSDGGTVGSEYRIEGITGFVGAGNDITFTGIDTITLTATAGSDTIDARFVQTVPAHDIDTVTLNGWIGGDQFLLFTDDQKGGSGSDGVGSFAPSGTASGVASITLNGDSTGNPNSTGVNDDGNDIFGQNPVVGYAPPPVNMVGGNPIAGTTVDNTVRGMRPSTSTVITINGGTPPLPGNPAPLPLAGDTVGDIINIDVSEFVPLFNNNPLTPAPVLLGTLASNSSTTQLMVPAGNIAAFTYTHIEDLNLVTPNPQFPGSSTDEGVISGMQVGDFYFGGTAKNDNLTINGSGATTANVTTTLGSNVSFYIPGDLVAYGGAGNDIMKVVNYNHDVEFYGESGNDQLYGWTGNDKLVGGAGNDTIYGSTASSAPGNDIIWGDRDPVEVGLPDTELNRQLMAANVPGTAVGAAGIVHPVVLNGYVDKIYTNAGNDIIYAGPGDDGSLGTITSGSGDDYLFGGHGNDNMNAGAGNDRMYGGDGNDNLNGDAGNDLVVGNDGNDYLQGLGGQDVLIGGAGNDQLFGGDGNDLLANGTVTYTNGVLPAANSNSQTWNDASDQAMLALLNDWAANSALTTGGGRSFTNDFASGADQLTGGNGNDAFAIDAPAQNAQRKDFGIGGDFNQGNF